MVGESKEEKTLILVGWKNSKETEVWEDGLRQQG